MRKELRLATVRPASVLFVDLMASTFAVLFLVLVVSLLSESEEVAEKELARPRPRSAGDFKLIESVIAADTAADDHPFARHEETFGEIEIHDEWIRFGDDANSDAKIIQNDDEFQITDSLFRRFLERLKRRRPSLGVHVTVSGNGNFYKVFDLLDEYSLGCVYERSWGESEDNVPRVQDSGKDGISSIPDSSKFLDLARRSLQMSTSGSAPSSFPQKDPARQETSGLAQLMSQMLSSESAAAGYLRRFLDDNRHLDLWKYLTEKVYRERGYDVYYQTHRDHLTFYHRDLEEAFRRPIEEGGRRRLGPGLLLLTTIVMVAWFYREATLPPRRNRL